MGEDSRAARHLEGVPKDDVPRQPENSDHRGAADVAIGEHKSSSSWREQAFVRIAMLEGESYIAEQRALDADVPYAHSHADLARTHLKAAREASGKPRTLREAMSGASVERTMGNVNAAEINLLRLLPADELFGRMPDMVAHARRHLSAEDPRRQALEALFRRPGEVKLGPRERTIILTAVRGSSAASEREYSRVRSFRNVLLVTTAALTLFAVGTSLFGAMRPDAIALCFRPDGQVVCPTGDAPAGRDPATVMAQLTTS